jgi:HPt (histidine-containing phosphotransfer) domain-containing protein
MVVAPSDPAAGLPPELARKFEVLRQQFLQGLPARLQAIEASDDVSTCEKLFHQLAGVAGGYGFHELGGLAREAEQACRDGQSHRWIELKQHVEAAIRHTLRPQ